jgi:hypothetical protein
MCGGDLTCLRMPASNLMHKQQAGRAHAQIGRDVFVHASSARQVVVCFSVVGIGSLAAPCLQFW